MSHPVRSVCCAVAAACMGTASLSAQAAPDDLRVFLVAHGDSVRLLLTESPPQFGGFVVYRRLAGGASSWERRTPQPIRRVAQPAMAAGLIGADLAAVRRALGTTEDGELLFRLQSDDFAAYVLSLLHPQVAVVLGRLFTDTPVQRGASYEYRVAVVDNRGEETGEQIVAALRVTDIVPVPPSGVAASAGPRGVTVSWSHPPYAGNPTDLVIGFHVYRTDAVTGLTTRITGQPVMRNDVGPLEFADTLAATGARYRYEVRAVDLVRRESTPSGGVTVTALDGTPPRAPTGVVAVPGEGMVTVSWTPTPDTDVRGYFVERSTGLDQPFARLTPTAVPANTPYVDRTPVGGTPYFYRVVAVDDSGNVGRPSNAIAALPLDTTPPAPPSGVTVAPSARTLSVRWTASPSGDVRGYYVYRGETLDRLVRLVEQPIPGTSFVDVGYGGAGLTAGGRYMLRVSAVDNAYNESEPVEAEVVVPDDVAPDPPTAPSAANVRGRFVEVTWSASPSLDVRSYEVLRAPTGASPVVIAETEAGGRAVRDSTAVTGVTYAYQVIAVDSAGNRSAPAATLLAFADAAPPPAPRYLAAVSTTAGVEITWERVAAEDLAGYHVYRALEPTGVRQRLTDVPLVDLRFFDAGGTAQHYYSVRAVDRSGNESVSSPTVRGRAP